MIVTVEMIELVTALLKLVNVQFVYGTLLVLAGVLGRVGFSLMTALVTAHARKCFPKIFGDEPKEKKIEKRYRRPSRKGRATVRRHAPRGRIERKVG